MATAQFDYSSNEAGDLPFRQGDRITLLAKESDDWWRGEVNGREGLFPASEFPAMPLIDFGCSLALRRDALPYILC